MAGLPVETDPNTGQTNVLDTNYVTRSQGTTAQNMSGVYLEDNSASVGNSSAVIAPGDPAPGYTTVNGVPGYPAVGQPGGNPSLVSVPNTDGNGAAGASIQLIGSPAGTAGGGTYYPSGFQSPATAAVPNPMVFTGWTAQAKADEDSPVFTMSLLTPSAGSPTTGASGDTFAINVTSAGVTITPTLSGGTSTYTYVTTDVDGVTTSTLPTGFSMVASTGVVTVAESTTAGTYELAFRVTDSSTPARYATYGYTVVVTG